MWLQLCILLAIHAATPCSGKAYLGLVLGLTSRPICITGISDISRKVSRIYGSSSSPHRGGPVEEKNTPNPAVTPKKLQVDPLDDDFRSCRVFVSDLPDPCDWKHLKDHFRQYQPIYASVSKDMVTGKVYPFFVCSPVSSH